VGCSRLLQLAAAMKTYLLVATMIGWQGPSVFHGLSRESAKALKVYFESLGAATIMVPE
jgi:hypothetical protein